MKSKLPAGLVDGNLEIFANNDEVKAIYNGSCISFFDLPEDIIDFFRTEMLQSTEIFIALNKGGIKLMHDMLKQYVWCNYGGFDNTPDFDAELESTVKEFWDCGKRDNCPFEFTLCDKVRCGDNYLTRKEILVVKLIASGFPDKQICDEANITYLTVISHKKNIYKKLDVHSQAEITAFAYKNNLIS